MNRAAITRVEGSISAVLNGLPLIPGERLLIALSGGADSVAMTHGLHRLRDRLGVTVTAAHLNHRLRGDESDRDEHFVRALCERLQIELVVETAQDLAGSSNLEERAREVRYAFLNRVAERLGARHIAVAHHADDQVELFFLRLLRGSGNEGLSGMEWKNPSPVDPKIQLVRPPLNSKSEVTEELLWIRLMASPKRPATESVVIFTPLISGRRTVSVVISSSIADFCNLSTPTSFKMVWETQARIFFAPFFLR